MSIWSVVPLKSFKRPKSRLNDSLSLEQRRILVKTMFKDIINEQKKSKLFTKRMVVSEDKDVIKFARTFGVEGLLQRKPGLNQGISQIADLAKKKKIQTLLIIHGDVPRVDKTILKLILTKHKKLIKNSKKGVTLVPDTLGEGTNCMICSPPNIIKFRYGPGSCLAHLEEAYNANVKCQIYRSKKLAMDIDQDADLNSFLKKKGFLSVDDYISKKL